MPETALLKVEFTATAEVTPAGSSTTPVAECDTEKE